MSVCQVIFFVKATPQTSVNTAAGILWDYTIEDNLMFIIPQ